MINNNDWINHVKNSQNPKVLVMLSGGKDSIASTIFLKVHGIDVTAIHFKHRWGEEIPTRESERICNIYDIPLIQIDYSDQFFNAIHGFKGGRPCALCKLEMYKILIEKMSNYEYGWLCIGDNANDRTTIARINDFIKAKNTNDTLENSEYLGFEMGIKLPVGVRVLRPLIRMQASDVEDLLCSNNIKVQRINSTGDKYFEYHREGCPIQFADVGVPITKDICESLLKYNEVITKFARENNILASIHMPSGFIVTIPRGNEENAMNFLKKEGMKVFEEINTSIYQKKTIYMADICYVNKTYFDSLVYSKLFNRLLERLEIKAKNIIIQDNDELINVVQSNQNICIQMTVYKKNQTAMVIYKFIEGCKSLTELRLFDNLILELFRTRKYRVEHLVLGEEK